MLAVATGLLLICAALLPGSAAAQSASQPRADTRLWYQAYSDGTAAIQRKDWQAAVDSLEAAKRAHPAVGRRIAFYGDIVRPFDPDYYLGTAYLNLKRFADADAAFQRVRGAKLIVPGDPEYSAFNRDATAALFEHQMANAEAALKGKDYGTAQQAAAIARNTGVDSARVDDLTRRISSAQAIAQAAPAGGAASASSTNTQCGARLNTPPGQGPVNPPGAGPWAAAQGPGTPAGAGRRERPPARQDRRRRHLPLRAAAPVSRPPAATGTSRGAPKLPRPRRANDEQIAIETFLSGTMRLRQAVDGDRNARRLRAHAYRDAATPALVLTGRTPAVPKGALPELAEAGPLTQFTADERFFSPRILQTLEAQR
jgi:hypothetical protein